MYAAPRVCTVGRAAGWVLVGGWGGGRVVTGCERGREENMGQAVHTPVLTIIADEQYVLPTPSPPSLSDVTYQTPFKMLPFFAYFEAYGEKGMLGNG